MENQYPMPKSNETVNAIVSDLDSKLLYPFKSTTKTGTSANKVADTLKDHFTVVVSKVTMHINEIKNKEYENHILKPKMNFGQRLSFLFSNKIS